MRKRMKLHTKPFLASTFFLTTGEVGAFAMLLFHWHEHNALPPDDRIHVVARMPKKEWDKSKGDILSLFDRTKGHSEADMMLGVGLGHIRPAIPKDLRERVMERDRYTCVYCGAHDRPIHLDHLIPWSRGGEDSFENLAVACVKCNTSKGALTADEFRRRAS